MQSIKIKKIELKHKISQIPEQKLEEVDMFLKSIVSQLNLTSSKPISLKGIWKNKGFEKISDLGSELKSIRSKLNNSILKKES